jgi:hypothetical protein
MCDRIQIRIRGRKGSYYGYHWIEMCIGQNTLEKLEDTIYSPPNGGLFVDCPPNSVLCRQHRQKHLWVVKVPGQKNLYMSSHVVEQLLALTQGKGRVEAVPEFVPIYINNTSNTEQSFDGNVILSVNVLKGASRGRFHVRERANRRKLSAKIRRQGKSYLFESDDKNLDNNDSE